MSYSSWLFDTVEFLKGSDNNIKDDSAIGDPTSGDDRTYVLADDDKNSTCSSMNSQQAFESIDGDGIAVLGAPSPNTFWGWNSKWSGRIVKDKRFKRAVIFLIILNSIFMGIGTFDFVTENPKAMKAFDTLDSIFLLIFSGEIILQLLYHRKEFFTDGWLIFDLTIVLLSWFMSSFLIMRAFRIVRTLRLATRIKPLKSVVTALLRAVPKMLAIGFLLSILFYIFAVLFTSLYKNLYRDGLTSEDYFSRMDITAFTLFQLMTLDSWSGVTKEVMATQEWAWLPFISFVMIASFIFLNLIIAVLCEAVSNIHNEKREKLAEEFQAMAAPSEQVTRDIARLERKIDDLTNKLELLLRSQYSHDSQRSVVTIS